LHSDALTPQYALESDPTAVTLKKSSCIRSIPAYLLTGDYETFDKPTAIYTFCNPQRISKMDFSLKYDDGTVVDLHNYRFSFTLELYYDQDS